MKNVIALVGLPGSGKTEVIEFLQKEYELSKIYFGDVTFDEMKARNLEVNEKNERIVREDLRKKFGNDIYCKRVIEKIVKIKTDQNVLVESLYSWPEYLGFKKKFGDKFKVVAVYSSPATRYARLSKRKIRPLDPETAHNRDYAQIENLTQGAPIAIADYTIVNEGTKKELFENVKKLYRKINAKR